MALGERLLAATGARSPPDRQRAPQLPGRPRSPAAAALGPALGALHRQSPQPVGARAVALFARGSRHRRRAALRPLLFVPRRRPRGLHGRPERARLFLRLHGWCCSQAVALRGRRRRGAPRAEESDPRHARTSRKGRASEVPRGPAPLQKGRSPLVSAGASPIGRREGVAMWLC